MTKYLTRIALLAAIYAAISIVLAPISYGPLQVRIAESLTLLPFYYGPHAAVGLWIGCIFANAFGGLGILDMTFGAGLTLISGLITSVMPNRYLAALPPIFINGIGIGWMLHYLLGVPLLSTMIYVAIGQLIAVGIMGIPLIHWLVNALEKKGWTLLD